VLSLLDAFILAMKRHCEDEEFLMCWHAYPKLEEHRAEHDRMIAHFVEVRASLEAGSNAVTAQVIKDWIELLDQHILHFDREYAKFLRPAA
jgi:hemerythrin-like metal-binding protein